MTKWFFPWHLNVEKMILEGWKGYFLQVSLQTSIELLMNLKYCTSFLSKKSAKSHIGAYSYTRRVNKYSADTL